MGVSYSPKIVTDGLTFCIDPANPRSYVSGSSDTFNMVNLTQSGSINGVTYVSPPTSASCWNFDAVDDYIEIGTILHICFWISLGIYYINFIYRYDQLIRRKS